MKMVTSPLTSFACVLLLGFIPSVRTRHHDLRRELASVKDLVEGIESKETYYFLLASDLLDFDSVI